MHRANKMPVLIFLALCSCLHAFPFGASSIFGGIPTIPTADRTLQEQESMTAEVMAAQWDSHMKNFSSSDIITFDLLPRQLEVFGEDIAFQGLLIQGAYFTENKEAVDFKIIGPDNNTIFTRRGTYDGLFYFYPNITGKYTFLFNNKKWMGTVKTTFAFTVGKVGDGIVQRSEIDSKESSLKDRFNELEELRAETKFFFQKQEANYKNSELTHGTVYYVVLFETLLLVTIVVLQVYYIKGLFDRRSRLF